jgi:CDP-diacylglycerol--serine O-phosphatidyltransferase
MTRAAASQFRWANLLTYLAVAAAAIATMFAQGPSSRFWAGAGIALAMAFDLFDGRFARLFPRTEDEQRVGIEIDSLADVMAFGLAPAVCLFRIVPATGPASTALLLTASIFYVLCIVTRLAHFNVFQAGTGGFIGLPSNLAALTVAICLFWVPDAILATVVLAGAGAATVSGFRIRRPNALVLYTLLAIALVVAGGHIARLLE